MILSCIHTHTTFCDGAADVETMCAAAFAKGFESIGFSSHAPIAAKTGIKTSWHLPGERLAEYIDTVLAARRRWAGRLKVFLGLEVDYIRGLRGPGDRDILDLPLDYTIGAVHYVPSPRGELFVVDAPEEEFVPGFREYFDNDGEALVRAYWDAYGELIRAGGCDVLAHLDLVKKNNARLGFFSPEDPEYRRQLAETVDLIAEARSLATRSGAETESRRPVVEVNTGGIIRGRTPDAYPSLAMLRLLRERNVPLTINADAHAPDHLGGAYGTAAADMRKAGYTAMLVFDGQAGKARWREEPLDR
ncbi:MAG: histidinol-phosphatase [Treponema sp.]|jgi:histidinol-phosphatase (PHP family)|nr:histidinol-phosphatase [Treponema sp.]